jgi:Uma2 family endonuclease
MTTPAENEQWPLTFEEYLRFEALAEVRHEFVGGQVYAMTGGSRRHGQMAALLLAALQAGLLDSPCRVYSHDTKLRVPSGAVYYPDVFVSCGRQGDPYVEDDATWVIEVLADTTRDKDDREKSLAYLQLPSLKGYLLVETSSRTIQLRTPTDLGWHTTYLHERDVLDLDGVRIGVRDLYDRLDAKVPLSGADG